MLTSSEDCDYGMLHDYKQATDPIPQPPLGRPDGNKGTTDIATSGYVNEWLYDGWGKSLEMCSCTARHFRAHRAALGTRFAFVLNL